MRARGERTALFFFTPEQNNSTACPHGASFFELIERRDSFLDHLREPIHFVRLISRRAKCVANLLAGQLCQETSNPLRIRDRNSAHHLFGLSIFVEVGVIELPDEKRRRGVHLESHSPSLYRSNKLGVLVILQRALSSMREQRNARGRPLGLAERCSQIADNEMALAVRDIHLVVFRG